MWSTSRRKNLVGYERLAFTKYLVLESFLRYIVKILLKFCRFLESIVDFLVKILVRYNWGIFIVTVMVSISLLSGLILIIFLILEGSGRSTRVKISTVRIWGKNTAIVCLVPRPIFVDVIRLVQVNSFYRFPELFKNLESVLVTTLI